MNKYKVKQIKMCSQYKKGTILRLNKKNFEDEEFPDIISNKKTNN